MLTYTGGVVLLKITCYETTADISNLLMLCIIIRDITTSLKCQISRYFYSSFTFNSRINLKYHKKYICYERKCEFTVNIMSKVQKIGVLIIQYEGHIATLNHVT